jgi:hypothetical protein
VDESRVITLVDKRRNFTLSGDEGSEEKKKGKDGIFLTLTIF